MGISRFTKFKSISSMPEKADVEMAEAKVAESRLNQKTRRRHWTLRAMQC